jgi:uncharacterized Ntn-hydrolase superfamily protein
MTYSIVAFDAATGELGVAVQSHYFSVGTICPWVRPGVGAVATQAMADPSYGPLGLELLAAGKSPADALHALTTADPAREQRQVAIVDAEGRVATHTGASCIGWAGHRSGDGYSVQANMMLNDSVCDAMAEAFESAEGPLAERLLSTFGPAEAEGGDIRGRQSAAIVVSSPNPRDAGTWRAHAIDLRVDDHADPIGEIARLLALKREYDRMEHPDAIIGSADVAALEREHRRFSDLSGGNPELAFWLAVSLAGAGREDDARAVLQWCSEVSPTWPELLRRLPAAGLLTGEPDVVERLIAGAGEPA